MKAVILGKASSKRIIHKNYKPFYKDMCLVDILVEKLVRVLDKKDIFLSCEDSTFHYIAEKWGINFIHREKKYTLLKTNTVEVVYGVCKDIPGQDDILYCSGMDPLFNDYENMFRVWEEEKAGHDTLNVVYPIKNYFLDQNHNPIGFGFGSWHKYSQYIPPLYQISWANEILTRESINRTSYMVGTAPLWFDAYNPTIDIDTEQDWEIAQVLYKYCRQRMQENSK